MCALSEESRITDGAARDQPHLAVSDPDPDQRDPGEVAVVRVDLGNHSPEPVSDRVGGEVVDALTDRVAAGVTRQRVEPQQDGPAARRCPDPSRSCRVQSTAMIASKVRMTLKTRACRRGTAGCSRFCDRGTGRQPRPGRRRPATLAPAQVRRGRGAALTPSAGYTTSRAVGGLPESRVVRYSLLADRRQGDRAEDDRPAPCPVTERDGIVELARSMESPIYRSPQHRPIEES